MMEELLKLAKQNLSIVETSTIKDDEIKLIIKAGIEDIKRQGICLEFENALVVQAIMMYVKANFGNVALDEKNNSEKVYRTLCTNLSLSYKED